MTEFDIWCKLKTENLFFGKTVCLKPFMKRITTGCSVLLTLWNESRYKAGSSGDNIGCCKRQPSTDSVNCEEDEEGSREFHYARNEEVNVDISTQDPQTHDQTLIHHSASEPVR